ncbi:MAG: SAM-dependent methyltransferase [Chloroflexi bacterium]|nr:SAM-dependent methyltransferase [Chloroflexota bacterium]
MRQTALHIAEAVSKYIVEPSRTCVLDMISACDTVERANEELRCLTGVRHFFHDREAFEEFHRILMLPASSAVPHKSREWGDFQTPPGLATRVCRYLAEIGVSPRIIVEPTYGTGNFILAALKAFPTVELVYGVEIQEKYHWHLKLALLIKALSGHRTLAEIELHQDDIFTHRFSDEILKAQDMLIIGNPPWVTNAEIGALDAHNLPTKRNIKALKGIDAIMGKSNFDIGEFIVLRMLDLFSGQRGALAMLCKNSVIKNIVNILPQRRLKVSNIRALEIDASREFGASVMASLLVMNIGASNSAFTCQVATLDHPNRVTSTFGWTHKRFVSNVEDYEPNSDLDGKSPLVWRQGLKHDCAPIMELNLRDGLWVNGNGEVVDVEDQWCYWLLKSSDLRKFEVDRARRKVLVPQHRLGEDTFDLQENAPMLWEYLVRNSEYFERRKSNIYRNKPRFSIFGVGEYSFTAYKVAISGLYKEPCFSLVLPMAGCPVMLDDTCYFLGFDTYPDALFTASLLNSPMVKQFLQSIIFADAKRPYTKEALMRIDLAQAACRSSFYTLRTFWAEIGYKPRVSVLEADFEEYKQRLSPIAKMREGLQFTLRI